MTRIIAGDAGSLTLAVPPAGTRPTSDRVRESLFASLASADALEDVAVLDLYAGSGALGLESVSRGAASADLVERHPKAATIAGRNATAVAKALRAAGRTPAIHVHTASAAAFLVAARGTWDLVFIDPPYDLAPAALTETLELLAPRLHPDAIVVVERASRSGAPELPPGLEHLRDRRYGDTTLWWVQPR